MEYSGRICRLCEFWCPCLYCCWCIHSSRFIQIHISAFVGSNRWWRYFGWCAGSRCRPTHPQIAWHIFLYCYGCGCFYLRNSCQQLALCGRRYGVATHAPSGLVVLRQLCPHVIFCHGCIGCFFCHCCALCPRFFFRTRITCRS